MRYVCRNNLGRSRYEPSYVPGGTYESPRAGEIVVTYNDPLTLPVTVTDLTEFDMAELVTWLEDHEFRHVLG